QCTTTPNQVGLDSYRRAAAGLVSALEEVARMAVVTQAMTDEQRKSVALEYLKRLDRGEAFFDLFADDAQVYFPKWGLATGRAEIEKLFAEFASILSSIRHDYAYFNYIIQGDHVVVEGTS